MYGSREHLTGLEINPNAIFPFTKQSSLQTLCVNNTDGQTDTQSSKIRLLISGTL